jgi:hypothetical protein
MQLGQKTQAKAMTLGELRELIKQVDTAGFPDQAVVSARAGFKGKLQSIMIDSDERNQPKRPSTL